MAPEYKSLTIHVALIDGTAVSMRLPVLSNTELGGPLQIDLGTKSPP